MMPTQWYYGKRLLISLSVAIILSAVWMVVNYRQGFISKFFISPSNTVKKLTTTRPYTSYSLKPRQIREYPFIAFLNIQYLNGSENCAGTLIGKKYILTAAHCVDGSSSISIILGTDNILKEERSTVYRESENFIIHENYSNITYDNDIAVIYLDHDILMNEYVNTVPLFNNISTHGRTYVLGWGLVDLSQGLNDKLLVKLVTVVNNTLCSQNRELQDYSKLCAFGTTTGPCRGDSGGPLLLDNIQIGIVSAGDKYCNASVPTVYTNASYYWQWINDKIANHSN